MPRNLKLTDEQLDELAEAEYLEYLKSINVIRQDGSVDYSKIKYYPAQTLEELETLLDYQGGMSDE